ncbi:adenylate/guanylate cyclase domain-containing protein [Rhodovibrionaceae bacterium A322]
MKIDEISRKLMQSAHVGMAIVNVERMEPIFSNRYFKIWFQVEDDYPIGRLAEDLNLPEVFKQLEPSVPEELETTIKVKRRELSLAIHITLLPSDVESLVLIEIHNTTRIKEMEAMIQSYAKMVERNERDLKREKERAEKLLLNVMPKSVLEELKSFGVTAPRRFNDASVLMLDFVGFTEMDIIEDPATIVSELNDIFTNLDRIAEQFGCERIKTIGDAYMAVSGLPEPEPEHAYNIARVALLFLRYLEQRNKINKNTWEARVGIASGPVIGSIVGVNKYVYDIFGPAVNLAARMEQQANRMKILLCSPMVELIEDDFRLTEVGDMEIKGFGDKTVYRLEGKLMS